MKKILIAALLVMTATSAFAQFEQGKKYVGASLTGLDLSYSDAQKFHFGLDAKAGYFVMRDIMAIAEVGTNYTNKAWQEISLAAKGRYYIEQNGIFLGLGAKYTHMVRSYNDFAITPEVGYCYFLNHYLTVEPSLYYDMSVSDFSNHSKVGLKLGIGIYF
ncbi:MAG: hypothetical protein Q4A08_00865 [Bacteroidales bacterium]|nr:hypothetical protein [Bacteroidales bacterium]